MHKFIVETNYTSYCVECNINDKICDYVGEKGEIAYEINGVRVHIIISITPDIYKIGNDVYIYLSRTTKRYNSLYFDRITKSAVEDAIPYAAKAFKHLVKEVDTHKKYIIEF